MGAVPGDAEQLLFGIPRGERGELRALLCSPPNAAQYVVLRHCYPDAQGELQPGRGINLKISEAGAVAAGLMAFARTLAVAAKHADAAAKAARPSRSSVPTRTRTTRPQRELPMAGTHRQPQDDHVGAVSEEDRKLAEELF